MGNNKQIKQLFKKHEHAMRNILHEYFLVDCPLEEYDCLIHHILSILFNNGSKEDLKSMIETEISEHFGLSINNKQINTIVAEVWKYWCEFK